MSVNDIGVPGQPATNLTAWQASVKAALNSSDVTVDARISAAVAAIPRTACGRATTGASGVTIQLPAGFNATAVAVANLVGNVANTSPAVVSCTAVTAAGQFTIFAHGGGASQSGQSVQWIAVQAV